MSGWVNAVKCMFGSRLTANLIKKVLKGLEPKLDSATAVSVVVSSRRIHAPHSGGAVRIVFWRIGRSMRSMIASIRAAARTSRSIPQGVTPKRFLCTTDTQAQPATTRATYIRNDRPLTEDFSGLIDKGFLLGFNESSKIVTRHNLLLVSRLCLGLRELFAQFRRPFLFYHTPTVNAEF
jgi:hypothetical protein